MQQLTPDQQAGADLILRADIGIITGGPGTGKTFLLNYAIRTLALTLQQKALLLAPTGKAARRMSELTGQEASTIHRALHTLANETKPDVIIVDESSMMDINLLADLIPFAGASRMIFIGDVNQLPSVGPGCVFRDLIDSGVIPTVRLTEVHRSSANSWVCGNAPLVLTGKMDLSPAGDFSFVQASTVDDVILATRKIFELEQKKGRKFQILSPMHKTPAGIRNLNIVLQSARASALGLDEDNAAVCFHSRSDLFFVGDAVLHTKNNYQLNVFNGETGVVREISSHGLVVEYDKRFVRYTAISVEEELSLAHVMSVHKSQGSEYDSVAVVCHDAHQSMWSRQLLYTAITRSKSMVYLVGTKSAIEGALRNDSPQNRITTLKERILK